MTKYVPILNYKDEPIGKVEFRNNLTLKNRPAYVNHNCLMGLTRLTAGEYADKLVIMFYDLFYPSCSRGWFISDEEAYELCIRRGKQYLIDKLDIKPEVLL